MLLDINLGSADPAVSGLALARQLREVGGPPFIFLTAYSDLGTYAVATRRLFHQAGGRARLVRRHPPGSRPPRPISFS